MRESELQSKCVKWFRRSYPDYYELYFMIKNDGFKNYANAVLDKKMGLISGVGDTFLSIPALGKHGHYIEFKVGKNKQSDKQIAFQKKAEEQGYGYHLVYTFDKFKTLIINILHDKK